MTKREIFGFYRTDYSICSYSNSNGTWCHELHEHVAKEKACHCGRSFSYFM